MSNIYAFLAEGFEETEAIAVIDVLLRAEIETKIVSTTKDKCVKGAHGITICGDILFEEGDYSDAEILFLPGGMPGKINLQKFQPLRELLKKQNECNKKIAAICAAPGILGDLGILEGKEATCFPGFEKELIGATFLEKKVVKSENIITSRGMGTAIDMGLELVRILKGDKCSSDLAAKIQYY